MTEYHLRTIWRIAAPLEQVYAAIEDSLRWPEWWSSVKGVEQVTAGRADGINGIWHYSWQGPLPYRVKFSVCVTRIAKQVTIEGTACGDLEGTGRWHFSRQGSISVVRCEWHVRSTRWWMNLLAPLARTLFIRNHAQVMAQGGEGLAHRLHSTLVSQESIDLMAAEDVSPQTTSGRLRERGRIAFSMMLVTGIAAGVMATVIQLILWWLTDTPVAATFLRDVRLTAALVMGDDILQRPSTPLWMLLLVASLIHFALSVAYTLLPAFLPERLKLGPALVFGALYGLIIYVVNLYGFTLLFPWFVVTRDWITLVAHLVFGVALVLGCKLFRARE